MTDLHASPTKLEKSSNADVVDEFESSAGVVWQKPSEQKRKREENRHPADQMPDFPPPIPTNRLVVGDSCERCTDSIDHLSAHRDITSVTIGKSSDFSEVEEEVTEPRVCCEIVQDMPHSMRKLLC